MTQYEAILNELQLIREELHTAEHIVTAAVREEPTYTDSDLMLDSNTWNE